MVEQFHRFVSFFIICLATTVLVSAHEQASASDIFSLDGSAKEVRERAFDIERKQQRKSEQLRLAGDQCFKNGETKEALANYDASLKIRFSDWAGLGKGKALMKLGRLPEAVAVLEKVNNYTTSIEAWTLRVECLIKLHQYADGYAVCEEIRQNYYPEYLSFLMRAKILEASNKKAEARQCLLNGIAHCCRYKAEKQDLVDELYKLGSEPPDAIPKITTGNRQLQNAIKDLISLVAPLNQRELFAKFREPAYPAMISCERCAPVANWSGIGRSSPIEQVSNTNRNEITLRCNLDLTYITLEELELLFGHLQKQSDSNDSKLYTQDCPNGQISFRFDGGDPNQLYFVSRTFNPVTPEKFTKFDFEVLVKDAKTSLSQGKYNETEERIIHNWHCVSSLSDVADRVSKLKELRELLVKCELKRPEVQAYLKQVCLLYLQEDVEAKNRFDVDFPTAKQYEKLPWHRTGSCVDPSLPDSYYVVYKESYPAIFAAQESALFRLLYLKHAKETQMTSVINDSLPPKLLDDAYQQNLLHPQ